MDHVCGHHRTTEMHIWCGLVTPLAALLGRSRSKLLVCVQLSTSKCISAACKSQSARFQQAHRNITWRHLAACQTGATCSAGLHTTDTWQTVPLPYTSLAAATITRTTTWLEAKAGCKSQFSQSQAWSERACPSPQKEPMIACGNTAHSTFSYTPPPAQTYPQTAHSHHPCLVDSCNAVQHRVEDLLLSKSAQPFKPQLPSTIISTLTS